MNKASLPEAKHVAVILPAALIDHYVLAEDAEHLADVVGELGGSCRVGFDELDALLTLGQAVVTRPGGSAANTARALALGFGARVELAGACGADDHGHMFITSMKAAGVGTSGISQQAGARTGRSAVLLASGERTMRTALDARIAFGADHLKAQDHIVAGAAWLLLTGYALYQPGLFMAALLAARAAGVPVAFSCASFEVVRAHAMQLCEAIEGGLITCAICNEAEAAALVQALQLGKGCGAPASSTTPAAQAAAAARTLVAETALEYLVGHCRVAVVTLGPTGCVAAEQGQRGTLAQPAAEGVAALDSTGCGDAFAAGFLHTLMQGRPLRACAQAGCLAGGAVVQHMGADPGPEGWAWLRARLERQGASTHESTAVAGRLRDDIDAVAGT